MNEMLGLFVMLSALAACQGKLCESESRINCSCRNDGGNLFFVSSHNKADDSVWYTSIKGSRRYCPSHSALKIWKKIASTTCDKVECIPTTPSPPRPERPSESVMINNGYKRIGSSLYKFHTNTQDWEKARRTCQSEGAHLAIVNSNDEARILQHIFSEYPKVENTWNNLYALIGFHDQFTEGNYLTIFGEPIEEAGFAHWEVGNPDNLGWNGKGEAGENCGSFTRNGKLNDINCWGKLPFFCELEDGTYPPITEINYLAGYYTGVEAVIKPPPGKVIRRKPSSGYRHYPGVGFYKVHTKTNTWENARRICESENAHLAIINSDQESAVLNKLFSKKKTSFDTHSDDQAFIGIHDQFTEGKFVTIYNETLESTGFSKWLPSEPNNLGASNINVGEDCGSMIIPGLLNDVSCHRKLAFICEQPLLE